MRRAAKVGSAVLVIVLVAIAAALMSIVRRGISARVAPTRAEEVIARAVRPLAVPASMRDARNPVPLTASALGEARAHWADHCAGCHANDGSGHTEMGRNLYPKAPDMRQPRTQQLSDGELFSIIRNGVRLTGMPAWGDASGRDDAESWKLVHFIRHLPKLTPQELKEMKALNPVSPAEMKEERAEEEFLKGHD